MKNLAAVLSVTALAACGGGGGTPATNSSSGTMPVQASKYVDNQNGTVTDPKSGLIWMRCEKSCRNFGPRRWGSLGVGRLAPGRLAPLLGSRRMP